MAFFRRVRVCTLILFLAVAITTVRAGDGESRRSSDSAVFSESIYLRDVEYLASDELEGRGTGQPGIDVAAEYIARELEAAGVQPAGDKGTFFQNFTLKLKSRIGDDTRLTYAVNNRRTYRTAAPGEDYTPLPFSDNGPFSGEVVFAGYGIEDEDLDYDDFKGVDVEGKVVLVLRRAPKFDDFSPRSMSFMAKAQRAAAHDATAVLVVNPTDDEEGDKLYSMDSGGAGRRGGFNFGGNSIPIMHVRQALADELLKAGGLGGLADVQKKIETGEKPASALLKGVRVKGYCKVEPVESPVRNVVGIVPGAGPNKDEIIIIGGHYDHLGIRNKGDAKFNPLKDISNGADDNASGTTGVMMLARAYAKHPPNRSLLVMLYTAEEIGLLGSQHFAKTPTEAVDLKKCVAMLNFDMIGRLKDNKLEVGGMRTGGFQDMIHKLAEPYEFRIIDGGGGRGPSDHTSFYNKNIPVLFFFTGIHKQYHQPEDDTPLLNIPGAIKIVRYAADVIDTIDASPERPPFKTDTSRETLLRQDAPETAAAPLAGPARPGVKLGVIPGEGGDNGLLVREVQDDTAASRAGLKPGDRIVRIGEAKITDRASLLAVLGKLKTSDTSSIVVSRDGDELKLSLAFDGSPTVVAAAKPADAEKPPQPASLSPASSATVKRLKTLLEAEPAQDKLGRAMTCKYRVVDDKMTIVVWEKHVWRDRDDLYDGWIRNQSRVDLLNAVERFLGGTGTCRTEIRYAEWAAGTPERFDDIPELDAICISLTRRFRGAYDDSEAAHWARPKSNGQTARADAGAGHGSAVSHGSVGASPHGQTFSGGDHGHEKDDAAVTPKMPPVRLGISPTYAPEEGEGFAISGVSENGPAAKAGMKDTDRILRIGSKKVTDVYSYMASLTEFRPNQVIEVEVLRDGKRVVLKVKCDAQKPAEPS